MVISSSSWDYNWDQIRDKIHAMGNMISSMETLVATLCDLSLADEAEIKMASRELREKIEELKCQFERCHRSPSLRPKVADVPKALENKEDVNVTCVSITPFAHTPVKKKEEERVTPSIPVKKGGNKDTANVKEEKVDTRHIGRINIRVGKIISIEKHPDADSLYIEKVDVGNGKIKTIISGLVKFVPMDQLLNRMALFVCNLKPVKMRGILSEGMLLCASTPDTVEPLVPPENAALGDIVTVEGFCFEPDPVLNPKHKIFEGVAMDLKVNEDGVATYKGIHLKVSDQTVKAPSLKNVFIK